MMLSRRPSNASDRSAMLKSQTCVQTRSLALHEHHRIDLETAQKQAVAAASFAFERANERALAAQGLKESNIEQAAGIDEQVGMGQHLGRKQSIRFTGLTAVPIRRLSITHGLAPENNDVSSLPEGAQNGSYKTGSCFSGYAVLEARISPQSKGNSQESHVSSSSASLRKLKRARSMFTLRESATNLFGDNRPSKNSRVQQNPACSKTEHSQPSAKTESHLQRSFSFLRGEKDHMAPRLDTLRNQSVAAQLAREQYLRQLEEKGLKGNSSSPTPGQNHKSQKAFRKSVRSGSTISYRGAIGSPAQAPKEFSLPKRLGYKARSLSSSFKQKLKHVFQRASDVNDTIPVQQLHASRLHFEEYPSQYLGASQEYHQIHSPDSEILRKARSRESSLGKAPDFLEGICPTENIRNIRDEDGTSHLFASWVSPISGHISAATQSREKKRLSVIQEHGGPHQPSSCNNNHADTGKLLLAPFRNTTAGQQIEKDSFDNQRIHSALQQNIDENRRLAQHTGCFREEEEVEDGVAASTSKLQRASLSTHSLNSILVEGPSPDHGVETSNLVIVKPMRTGSTNNDIHPTQNRSSDYIVQEKFFGMYTSLTPEQIAVQNDSTNDAYPKQPLRKIKTAFFPSSMHIERTSVSPFRRMMGSSGDNESGADSELEENTPIGARSESAFGSASIYSKTSGGNTPKDNTSFASLAQSNTSHERAKSVIMKNLQSSPKESLAPLRRWREFPSQSQGCQDWMEPKIFEPGNRRLEDIQDLSATGKENRHKRESAQIDDDHVDVIKLKDETHMKQQGFGILLKHASPQLSLRHHASGSMFRRSPLLEIGQSAKPGKSVRCSSSSPRQPSTPHRSLYLDQETSSFGRNNQGSEEPGLTGPDVISKSQSRNPSGNRDGCMLRHGISLSTESIRIDTTRDMRGTRKPAPIRAVFRTTKAIKSQGYNSPERLARVRRLQSSNSPTSHNKGHVESNTEDNENGQNNEVIGPAFKDFVRIGDVLNQKVSSTACKEARVSEVRSMMNSFLNTRRNPEVNEDNGSGAAFL